MTQLTQLNIEIIFRAVATIIITRERSISIQCSDRGVKIRFPPTRYLAIFLNVQHYYVLPHFAMMETQGLVTREQRVGIWTTTRGSALLLAEIDRYYEGIAGEILGRDLLNALKKRVVSYNYQDDNTDCTEKSG